MDKVIILRIGILILLIFVLFLKFYLLDFIIKKIRPEIDKRDHWRDFVDAKFNLGILCIIALLILTFWWFMGEFGGSGFLAGASGTALVESMQSTLNNIEDPALRQIAAGLLGAAISEALTGKGQAGGSSAISTEKYNELKHQQVENK